MSRLPLKLQVEQSQSEHFGGGFGAACRHANQRCSALSTARPIVYGLGIFVGRESSLTPGAPCWPTESEGTPMAKSLAQAGSPILTEFLAQLPLEAQRLESAASRLAERQTPGVLLETVAADAAQTHKAACRAAE